MLSKRLCALRQPGWEICLATELEKVSQRYRPYLRASYCGCAAILFHDASSCLLQLTGCTNSLTALPQVHRMAIMPSGRPGPAPDATHNRSTRKRNYGETRSGSPAFVPPAGSPSSTSVQATVNMSSVRTGAETAGPQTM